MGKGWSILFGGVLFGTFILWPVSALFGWWRPENVSSYGGDADLLFDVILGFTAFFFVLTATVQVYVMWKFAYRPGEKSIYSHGNHYLEMVWTAVPAVILLGIAVAQISVWEKIKYRKMMPSPDLTVSVMARQWEWRMRYPARAERFGFSADDAKQRRQSDLQGRAWAENPEFDDIHAANEIHCWQGANVKIYLQTQDVLHSFTMPNFRIKQDTLPGKTIPMWFQATKANCYFDQNFRQPDGRVGPALVDAPNKMDRWEIACQELCGGRHYAMRGRVYVHKDKKSYDAWLAHTRQKQESRSTQKVALGD